MFNLDAIMTTQLLTISPSASVNNARSLMSEHRIRHLPVVDDAGALVGLLTQTDVYAAMDSILRDRENRLPVRDFPVEDVMVTEVITIRENVPLRLAAMYLEKHKIGCLPVLTDGRLVGIVTNTDFVGVAINLLEQLEETEPLEDSVQDFGDALI